MGRMLVVAVGAAMVYLGGTIIGEGFRKILKIF